MKRFWLGIGLMTLLLAVSIWVTVRMDRIHQPISEKLSQAAEAARDCRWDDVDLLLHQAETVWAQNSFFSATVADHEPMEEIQGLFAAALSYAAQRESALCAAMCARLVLLTDAMAESQAFTLRNLL